MKILEEVGGMWSTVKTSIQNGVVRTAHRKALDFPPKSCPRDYNGTEYEPFFGVCYYLSEIEKDGIFFASIRDLGEVLGLGYEKKASRMYRVLVCAGILTRKPEFKISGYCADRYQLNADYSSSPERKNAIAVHSWHRYTAAAIINLAPSSVWCSQVESIKTQRGLGFNTLDFCRRGEAAKWQTDYGLPLTPADIENAVMSYAEGLKMETAKDVPK